VIELSPKALGPGNSMIGVVGLGALGSLITYFLNRAGVEPYVVQRSRCETFTFCAERCTDLKFVIVEELPNDVEYTIVAVKAYDSRSAASLAKGLAVVVQNGVGGFEEFREVYPRALPAVATYGVYREGCRAELRGYGEFVLPRGAEAVAELLRRGGASARCVDDIDSYRWFKLAVNAAVNSITALLQVPNGFVVDQPSARELAVRLAEEVKLVASAIGVKLPGDPVDEALKVARATAANISSTASDVAKCRRTEVDYINGAVVNYGRKLGVKTPYNEAVYLLLKALEAKCSSRLELRTR